VTPLLPSEGKSEGSKLGCELSARDWNPNEEARFDTGADELL